MPTFKIQTNSKPQPGPASITKASHKEDLAKGGCQNIEYDGESDVFTVTYEGTLTDLESLVSRVLGSGYLVTAQ